MQLSQIRQGERVKLLTVPADCAVKQYLTQVGITAGSRLYCRYLSPGGDLAALEAEGIVLAMRRNELCDITVSVVQ